MEQKIKLPRISIIGAGFAGLAAARALSSSPVTVNLIDQNNYHLFLPLLYQIAAAEIEPEEIAYPIRSLLHKQPNANFEMSEVREINFQKQTIKTSAHFVSYDFLILCIGSKSHFFNIPGAAEYSFPIKTLEQGIRLRNHILHCFEQASAEPDIEKRRRLLTFVIIGGGPTGVEFTGALAELIRKPLVRDFPKLDFKDVRVILLQATDSLLSDLPERLRNYTAERLRRLGVEVRLKAIVNRIQKDSVSLQDGNIIPAETIIWTAGVGGDPLGKNWGLPVSNDGRVEVLPTLQVSGQPKVYIAGDLAWVKINGKPLPLIAPVAIQQGTAAAKNILRQIAGQEPLPFFYHEQGAMVVIGRNTAVARLGNFNFTGISAWLIWIGVHLFKLIGFRNRFFVLINWARDYLFFDRAVRLILSEDYTSSKRVEKVS